MKYACNIFPDTLGDQVANRHLSVNCRMLHAARLFQGLLYRLCMSGAVSVTAAASLTREAEEAENAHHDGLDDEVEQQAVLVVRVRSGSRRLPDAPVTMETRVTSACDIKTRVKDVGLWGAWSVVETRRQFLQHNGEF